MRAMQIRNTVLALAGAAALVFKRSYVGPLEGVVHAYGGNVAVSFSLYFAAALSAQRFRRPPLAAAGLVLLAVTAFEVSDGFGFMSNVYDPLDILANATGVVLAVAIDTLTHGSSVRESSSRRPHEQ